jgi:hypothetical protein
MSMCNSLLFYGSFMNFFRPTPLLLKNATVGGDDRFAYSAARYHNWSFSGEHTFKADDWLTSTGGTIPNSTATDVVTSE